ncbi:MAG: phosphotransferase [Candidatus Hydrogenedentes bacterium]|nr:phosphotransferase [Candidatus Hydrogenedentota bacterium]
MTSKLSGAEVLAETIREHYDLGRVGLPHEMPDAHQRRHRKLIVETGEGKFLVKTYKRDPHVLDALRFQHRLSDHLAKNDLPVARIQPARNGKRIVEADTWALELQQFVEGDPMVVTGQTLLVSSKALGRFHEVCRDFPRPERDARMWRFSEVPRASFAKLYERAKEKGDTPIMDDYCNRIALFLKTASEELSYEARSRFETGLIHGDWHSGNLLFRDEELVGILDLEFAGDGCYLEDLSYALSNLAIRTTMKPDRLAKRVDLVLYHYQKFRSLSLHELVALYYAVGVKHIATVSYQIEQHAGKVAGFTAGEWLERLALQCDWLAEQARKVRWG